MIISLACYNFAIASPRKAFCYRELECETSVQSTAVLIHKEKLKKGTRTFTLQGLDAERDVLRESQRLASERDRELETLRQQVRYSCECWNIVS